MRTSHPPIQGAPSSPPPRPARSRAPLAAAVVVALGGAGLLTLILGVLLSTGGTFFVSGVAGALIGLLVAGSVPRSASTRVALVLAGGMMIAAAAGVWILSRAEGGVMDPLSYLWTTFGFGIPAEAFVALLAAAWGAANGPLRWRS